MRKSVKIILIILGIWVLMFLTDFICVKTIKKPIFMIHAYTYKDGGTKVYYGLGYKVINYSVIDGDNYIHMGTYFMNYDPVKAPLTDATKFSKEYINVKVTNVFVYKNINEIINILEHGTGIVYLGFPECKWCQAYVPMLNDVAIDNDLNEIYYFNILNDRTNNTQEYKKIVDILSDYLQYDKEGNKRIYVPSIIAVKDGKVIGFNDETSYDTKGYEEPTEYWNDDAINKLKEKLKNMIEKINIKVCTECNE